MPASVPDLFRELFPRIVGSDVPDVTLRIAARKTFASVALVFQIEHYLGAGGFGSRINGIAIRNDEIGTLRFLAFQLIRLL